MAKVTRQRMVKKSVKTRHPSGSSFLDGIKAISEPTSGIKMALYGRSGSGKTSFACTFPGKKLLIRCGLDDGTRSVFDVEDVDVTPLIKKSTDLDDVIKMQREEGTWDTVILDTASEFRRVCLTEVIGLESVPTQLSWGIARMDQYGDAALGVKERLRDLLDLAEDGTNVIIIAQEGSIGEAVETTDLLTPSIAQDLGKSVVAFLNPACDYVVQSFIRSKLDNVVKKTLKSGKVVERIVPGEGYEYCLRTRVHDTYSVKFRAPRGTVIPDVLVDPVYDRFYELITGKSK